MGWVRSGECCGCGDCCKGDPFHGEEGRATVIGYCPLYRWHGSKGHCVGYGKHPYYLGGCVSWPSIPEHIKDKPSCTYKFEWAD